MELLLDIFIRASSVIAGLVTLCHIFKSLYFKYITKYLRGTKNHYEELEISPKASKEVIQSAYSTLFGKYFHANNMDETEATEKIKRIKEAYEILSDTEKRMQYDKMLKTAENQKAIEKITTILDNPLQDNECREQELQKAIKTLAKQKAINNFFFGITLTLLAFISVFYVMPNIDWISEYQTNNMWVIFILLAGFTLTCFCQMSQYFDGIIGAITSRFGAFLLFAYWLGLMTLFVLALLSKLNIFTMPVELYRLFWEVGNN